VFFSLSFILLVALASSFVLFLFFFLDFELTTVSTVDRSGLMNWLLRTLWGWMRLFEQDWRSAHCLTRLVTEEDPRNVLNLERQDCAGREKLVRNNCR
jgi:hypothetical protein